MNDSEWLAARFEDHRPRLRSVAYRMLGSLSEADDAVQDAWIRVTRADASRVDNLGGWLTTIVARVCLNMLRARRTRREAPLESHLPDPVVSPQDGMDPEQEALLADSVGLAMLVVLDSLTPAERVAFVLHDVFAVPFDEIAPLVERSPAATRQLASRARRRVRAEAPQPDADVEVQRQVVDAFLAAAREGHFAALLRVLDPNVVVRIDGGPGAARPFRRPPIVGAREVATATKGFRHWRAPAEQVIVNGAAGVLFRFPARALLAAFTVTNGRIVAIDLIADPAKLRGLPAG